MGGNMQNTQNMDSTANYNLIKLPLSKVVMEDDKDARDLLRAIYYAKIEWQATMTNFETADADELVDYYIYQMKACEARYQFLLKKAKELGLKAM